MDSLVTTEWLEKELQASDLRIVDSTWCLPADGRDPRAEYEAEHIPGAVFLDLDEVSDSSNPVPHMVPPEPKFASRMASLGLGDGQRFVVYDNSPLHSAARAWWMLRSFGAHYVAILDGGLQKWKSEGRPLESGRPRVRHGHFSPRFDPRTVADKAAVTGLLGDGRHQIVDARGAGRFSGEEAEPRPGMASGHIPGSRNLPQGSLFSSDNSWKQGDELRSAFAAAGVDLGKPMVATCGSGVTACVLLFGAHLLGKEDVRLYDGSWSEWGADPATPKATGPA
ncbi:MAG TPA: 3-mercaptopyruvate sulfurtransferase [Allosphingosinicella sp.]|nr:3-mercaptopyruvate sulfurtransferase [Allosphingosinicella sp.]